MLFPVCNHKRGTFLSCFGLVYVRSIFLASIFQQLPHLAVLSIELWTISRLQSQGKSFSFLTWSGCCENYFWPVFFSSYPIWEFCVLNSELFPIFSHKERKSFSFLYWCDCSEKHFLASIFQQLSILGVLSFEHWTVSVCSHKGRAFLSWSGRCKNCFFTSIFIQLPYLWV